MQDKAIDTDTLIYRGVSFSKSAVKKQKKELFVSQHMTIIWAVLKAPQREEELEKVYELCCDLPAQEAKKTNNGKGEGK